MLGSALIIFRETLEAALLIGILAAASRGLSGRNLWLGIGIGIGFAGALVVAGLTGYIAEMAEGTGQELFNAAVLGVAVVMLGWHNIWMARHGREMAAQAKSVGLAVQSGRREMSALAVLIALAVLREGSESVLFLYGLAMDGRSGAMSMFSGGMLGLFGGDRSGLDALCRSRPRSRPPFLHRYRGTDPVPCCRYGGPDGAIPGTGRCHPIPGSLPFGIPHPSCPWIPSLATCCTSSPATTHDQAVSRYCFTP